MSEIDRRLRRRRWRIILLVALALALLAAAAAYEVLAAYLPQPVADRDLGHRAGDISAATSVTTPVGCPGWSHLGTSGPA
jgi:hypothetical protein